MAYKLRKEDLSNPYSFSNEFSKISRELKKEFNIYDGYQTLDILNEVIEELGINTLEKSLILEETLCRKPMAIIEINQVKNWLIKEYKKKEIFLDLLGK